MLPILWRAEAQADLAAILGYIAERNPYAAHTLYDDIDRALSQLPSHPYMYRSGRVPGTREMIVRPNYVVVYRIGAASIDVVSVVHARQHYP